MRLECFWFTVQMTHKLTSDIVGEEYNLRGLGRGVFANGVIGSYSCSTLVNRGFLVGVRIMDRGRSQNWKRAGGTKIHRRTASACSDIDRG